ncbi:hypothetical protein [Nostoc sp. CMAA1605]|uniref:hypothetical protein n=1 Tax=Nostoc sp. CMAA1605 TaxID=2055159 RepID=UPI001F1E41D5|nr:hypothetical protein [Nostoc sp. CMAA1605]
MLIEKGLGIGDWGLGILDFGLNSKQNTSVGIRITLVSPTPLHPYTPTLLHPYTLTPLHPYLYPHTPISHP